VLEDCGYRVLVAHDGEEAVRTYEDNRESISAVLLDLRLPKMGGTGGEGNGNRRCRASHPQAIRPVAPRRVVGVLPKLIQFIEMSKR
jgi:DNA-binding response OmpR family regulator